jgi:hypothetical protein
MGETGSSRRRLRLLGVLILALCLAVGLAAGDAAAKKKKKKGPTVFSQSLTVNAPIPDEPPSPGTDTPVVSTLTVGKKFKGKQVGDVNVTGIRTTGDVPDAANDLAMSLQAPNGRYVQLISNGIGDQNIGPLTLDDDTRTSICNSNTPDCSDPFQTLIQPFAGTANLLAIGGGDTGPLSAFNGTTMRGTWTFRIWDADAVQTSTFNSWGLQITAQKPVK